MINGEWSYMGNSSCQSERSRREEMVSRWRASLPAQNGEEGTNNARCTYSISIFFSLFWVLCRVRLISSFIRSALRHLWWRASNFRSSGSALPSLYTLNKTTQAAFTQSLPELMHKIMSSNYGASLSSFFLHAVADTFSSSCSTAFLSLRDLSI